MRGEVDGAADHRAPYFPFLRAPLLLFAFLTIAERNDALNKFVVLIAECSFPCHLY